MQTAGDLETDKVRGHQLQVAQAASGPASPDTKNAKETNIVATS